MKIYLLAGEPSGDRLGAALMAGLRRLEPEFEFRGVAGPLMRAEGMESQFAMDELSVMGIAEVLPKYPALKRRLRQTAADVLWWKPDALVTIDSPDFSLRLARAVKSASAIRTVHYVAPSVWAWRPGRAQRMARHVDQVLALLPFEPPYMEAAGMRCDFVGHPVVAEETADLAAIEVFRRDEGLGDAKVCLVLPGSRRAEVERLAPIFGETLRLAVKAVPGLRVIVPAASAVADLVEDVTADWPGKPVVLDPRQPEAPARKRTAFAAADAALAASGTVSLELAAAGTPMVIAYDMRWLSWQIMSRMALIDTATLVNLISGTRAVPEFLGPRCRPPQIAEALADLLTDKTARQAQLDAMSVTMEKLGQGGEAPGLRAARAVLDGIAGTANRIELPEG